jgi:hypothetical protein
MKQEEKDLQRYFNDKLGTLMGDLRWRSEILDLTPLESYLLAIRLLMWPLSKYVAVLSSTEEGDEAFLEIMRDQIKRSRRKWEKKKNARA